MSGKTFAYFVYCLTVFMSVVTLYDLGIDISRWQWWVITACIAVAYLCGLVRGEKK